MRFVQPTVYLVAEPDINYHQILQYLATIEGQEWASNDKLLGEESATLVEAAGRICYRSWTPGLNANVSKTRTDQKAYIANLIAKRHGSVLEHANFTFIFSGVSRVFTHELARHRSGCAMSQESLRFMRHDDDIPFTTTGENVMDAELSPAFANAEAEYFTSCEENINENDSFSEKKWVTSALRRSLPMGMATEVMWTANARALRHIIDVRTAEGAECEMRRVMTDVCDTLQGKHPTLFGDFSDDGSGHLTGDVSKP